MNIPLTPNSDPIASDKIRFKLIPSLPYHDVIYSLAAGTDGKIYMGISSEFGGAVHGHLGCYDPKTDQFRDIIHLEDLIPEGKDRMRPPHAKIHTSMMAHPDGRILWVSHTTPPIEGEKVHRIFEIYGDPERAYLGSFVFSYDPSTDVVQNLGRLYPFNGTRFATLNPERDEIYTVSYPTAHFTVFRINTGESRDLGRIAYYDALGPCWSAHGPAYTTDDDGYIIRYDPDEEELEKLPVRIPSPPGHMGNLNRVRRVIPGPDGVKLYGLTGLSCRLYEYDPTKGRHGSIRDIGLLMGQEHFNQPNQVPQGKALTFGPDGTLYIALNVGGGEFPQVHLLRVDPETGEGEDYGVIEIKGMLPLHTVQDACTDQEGNIYLGTAMPEPPTLLTAFNPQELPENIMSDQEAELAPHRMGPEVLEAERQRVKAHFDEIMRYSVNRDTAFVSRGIVSMLDLGLEGYDPVIPAGESAVSALVMAPGGKLFGATTGNKSHLFSFWTTNRAIRSVEYPADLGVLILDGQEQHGCRPLIIGPDGYVYGGTNNADGRSGHLFRFDPEAPLPIRIEEFTYYAPQDRSLLERMIEDLGIPVEREGVRALVSDEYSQIIFGVSSRGTLFSYDPRSQALETLKDFPGPSLPDALLSDGSGHIYGSLGEGKLFRYSYENRQLETLPEPLPCGQGRWHINALSAATWGLDGTAYAGTTADGVLFAMDFSPLSNEVQVRSIGKPTWSGYIRALTTGNDGTIFGIVGRDDLISHLFSYHPQSRALQDLGILKTITPRPWAGHRFDAMVTGLDGEIYLGESDRISHLFVYHPTVRAPQRERIHD